MKYFFFTILIIPFYLQVFSQNDLSSIKFNLTEEKELFESYSKATTFKLLYHIDNEEINEDVLNNNITDFYAFLDELKKKVKKKKRKKAASIIYKGIHEKYFSKYVDNPIFYDIFSKREYNCVTASALFALGLDYLDIPFEIRETPMHVYLILYPNEDNILFESTTPGENLSKITAKQIEDYKNALVSNKIITEEESNDENFLNEYYLTDSTINLKELVAIHYYNSSFTYAEKEDYQYAFNQLEKAYYLYPSESIKFYLNYYLLLMLDAEIKYTKKEYCKYYDDLIAYNAEVEGIDKEIITIYILKVKQFLEKPDGVELLEDISTCLKARIKNDSLNKTIQDITHRSIAEFHYNAVEYDEALKHLMKVYEPKNKSLNLVVKECLIKKFGEISDPKKGLDSLSHYADFFPFILKDRNLLGFKAWCQLKLVYLHFEVDEFEEGISFFQQFKNDFKPDDNVSFPEALLGSGFGAVSSYYVRKNDYKLAKQILLEGLEFDPYNIHLKRKLKLLHNSYPELKKE